MRIHSCLSRGQQRQQPLTRNGTVTRTCSITGACACMPRRLHAGVGERCVSRLTQPHTQWWCSRSSEQQRACMCAGWAAGPGARTHIKVLQLGDALALQVQHIVQLGAARVPERVREHAGVSQCRRSIALAAGVHAPLPALLTASGPGSASAGTQRSAGIPWRSRPGRDELSLAPLRGPAASPGVGGKKKSFEFRPWGPGQRARLPAEGGHETSRRARMSSGRRVLCASACSALLYSLC